MAGRKIPRGEKCGRGACARVAAATTCGARNRGEAAGALFRLVIGHEQFACLHNLSEFVVRLDETLSGEEAVTEKDTHSAIVMARKMFAPSEFGDAFQKRYFDAIQRDPAVVMEHAELARLFANEPSDASAM